MFYYPSPQVSQLEHILVDNWDTYASNFSSAITPCTRYVTQIGEAADNSGRTTSAQWLRVVFHDFSKGISRSRFLLVLENFQRNEIFFFVGLKILPS